MQALNASCLTEIKHKNFIIFHAYRKLQPDAKYYNSYKYWVVGTNIWHVGTKHTCSHFTSLVTAKICCQINHQNLNNVLRQRKLNFDAKCYNHYEEVNHQNISLSDLKLTYGYWKHLFPLSFMWKVNCAKKLIIQILIRFCFWIKVKLKAKCYNYCENWLFEYQIVLI